MKKYIIALIIVFLATAANATTFYVRPGGHDTNCNGTVNVDDSAGVRPNCALQTVNIATWTYQVGDTISLLAGSIFRECGNLVALSKAGGTVTANGDTTTLGRPQLRCSTLVNGTVGTETVTAEWTKIGATSVYSTPVASIRNALAAWQDTDTILTKGASAELAAAGTFFPDTGANVLYVWTTDGTSPAGHVIELSKTDNYGWWVQAATTISKIRVLHGDHALFPGITFIATDASSSIVDDCEIGPTASFGVYVYTDDSHVADNITVKNSNIHHNWNGLTYAAGATGSGVKSDGQGASNFPTGTIISGNYLSYNAEGVTLSKAQDSVVKYNLLYHNIVNGIDHTNGISGHPSIIANNTNIHAPQDVTNGHAYVTQVSGNYATFKNNICYLDNGVSAGGNAHCIFLNNGSTTGITLSNNDWFVKAGSTGYIGLVYGGTARTAIADWMTDSGETGSISADPLFVTGSYRLQPTSPAINAGTDLCATLTTATDFAGNNVCVGGVYVGKGSAPEIGAYEYTKAGGLFQTFNKTNKFAPHRRLH